MILNAFYLNLLKFLTMAFVLAFIAYAANAKEVVMDLQPFPVCISCLDENSDSNIPTMIADTTSEQAPDFAKLPQISLMSNQIISVAVLNPDLVDFDSVRFAIVEVADLEIAAEYLSYSLEDINNDDQTDIVFYFSTQDLIPAHFLTNRFAHDTCLIVDILKTDKTIKNYNLCEQAIFIEQDNI
jgi:hypothetical protein